MKKRRTSNVRRLIALAAVVVVCTLFVFAAVRHVNTHAKVRAAEKSRLALRGEKALAHLKQEGVYDSLAEAVDASRYEIVKQAGGGYRALNPAQNYHANFTPSGVEVRPIAKDEAWRFGMKLSSYGYGERRRPVKTSLITAKGTRVNYELKTKDGAGLTEWYVNKPSGLEQGFTIPAAPGEKAAGEKLSLHLKLSGNLEATLVEGKDELRLTGKGASLRYDQFYAYDAQGKKLGARMALNGKELRLEVDDTGAVYPLTIDPTLAEEAKLTASDAAAGDLFGISVAIDGDTAVVSGRNDDNAAGTDAGSVYVFVRSGTSWSQQAKLTASDGAANDLFGVEVSISGETVVVGAIFDDDAGTDSGSAYVFVRSGTTWSEQAKLTAGDAAAGDNFGFDVEIDGDTAVIGAANDDTAAGSGAGSVYVFVRSGTSWSQQAQLTASDAAAADFFGSAVAISSETVVVSASGDDTAAGANAGSVYVFVRSGTSWSQQAKLTASDAAAGDQLGSFSLGISGDTVVAGARLDDTAAGTDAGSAYVFVRSGTSWSEQQKLTASDAAAGDSFGSSAGISGDTVVVGAQADDTAAGTNAGSVYVFTRSGTTWTEQQKLTASDAAAGDLFGLSSAIDGDTVVSGAFADDDAGTSSGSAYVFAPPNQSPVCSGATPSASTLWPPNHEYSSITIGGVTDPDGDTVTINIDSVFQDEATTGGGTGTSCPDAQGIDTSTAQVRRERQGSGNGRVYTISFTASDGNGGSCQSSVTVCVPKTQNGSCTNGGANFDSTSCGGGGGGVTSEEANASCRVDPASGVILCDLLDHLLEGLLCKICCDW